MDNTSDLRLNLGGIVIDLSPDIPDDTYSPYTDDAGPTLSPIEQAQCAWYHWHLARERMYRPYDAKWHSYLAEVRNYPC